MNRAAPPTFEKQAAIDALAAASFERIGSSRRGRPIWGRMFPSAPVGAGPVAGLGHLASAPRLLLVGGVHGDEPSSVEALLELAPRLTRAAGSLRASVFVVPALNPDGLALGQKNAASDVDLNRNFPASNFTPAHAPGYDPGPAPLSEPETVLLAGLVADLTIDAVVAVHAPFACVNFDGPARPWADAVAAACGWPVRESIGYPTPGSLGSWLGVDRGMPMLTLELPPGPLSAFRQAAADALDRACAYVSDRIS